MLLIEIHFIRLHLADYPAGNFVHKLFRYRVIATAINTVSREDSDIFWFIVRNRSSSKLEKTKIGESGNKMPRSISRVSVCIETLETNRIGCVNLYIKLSIGEVAWENSSRSYREVYNSRIMSLMMSHGGKANIKPIISSSYLNIHYNTMDSSVLAS